MSNRISIIKSSSIIAILSLAGIGAGFLLQVFLADQFGASKEVDAYLAATTFPTLINTVFITSLSITFIPIFVDYSTGYSQTRPWQIASSFTLLVGIFLTIVSLLGIVFSDFVIQLLAPGLMRFPSTIALAGDLQLLLFPSLIFFGLAGLIASIFYAQESFIIPSLGPIIGHGITLLIAWGSSASLGIFGVALGVLVGSISQCLFLFLNLNRQYSFRIQLNFSDPGIYRIIKLMVPWIAGALIYKANPVVDRFIASQFSEGAISILSFALNIITIATFVSTRGVSLSIFPIMSKSTSNGDRRELIDSIDFGLRMVTTVLTPVVLIIVIANREIITILFERGEFTRESTILTSNAVLGYLGALIALSFGNIISYVFYALKDTKTPAIVGIIGMGLNITFAIILKNSLGFLAPAVSFSIMAIFNLTTLTVILRRKFDQLVNPDFKNFLIKTVSAGLIMFLLLNIIGKIDLSSELPKILRNIVILGYQSIIGLIIYGILWTAFNRIYLKKLLDRSHQEVEVDL